MNLARLTLIIITVCKKKSILTPYYCLAVELAELRHCDTEFVLSKHDFVFLVHQGYQFLFFDTIYADDPPVFLYSDNEHEPKKIFDHFSEWLLAAVDDEIEAFESLMKDQSTSK